MEPPKQIEFWGIEVKAGQSVKLDPNEDFDAIIHITQVALGEIKKEKSSEPVVLHLKVADQKFVIGTLNKDTIPHIPMHVVLDKEAELSHSSKNASVFFTGYKRISTDDISYSDISDNDQELAPETDDHAQAAEVVAKSEKPAAETDDESDSDLAAKDIKTSDESDSDTSSEESKDDEETETPAKKVGQGKNSNGTNQASSTDSEDSDSEDSDSESDEETPAKKGTNSKRKSEARSPTPIVTKKAKNATPEKLDGRRVVHLATPYPSKKSGKTPQNGARKQTPNSNGVGTSKNGQQNKKSKQGRK